MQVASHLYAGPLDCLRQTVIKEGYRAVYKGASPPALGWAISDALLMGSLNTCASSPLLFCLCCKRVMMSRFRSDSVGKSGGWSEGRSG